MKKTLENIHGKEVFKNLLDPYNHAILRSRNMEIIKHKEKKISHFVHMKH